MTIMVISKTIRDALRHLLRAKRSNSSLRLLQTFAKRWLPLLTQEVALFTLVLRTNHSRSYLSCCRPCVHGYVHGGRDGSFRYSVRRWCAPAGRYGRGFDPLFLAVQAYRYRPQCSHLQHPQPSKPVLCKCISKIRGIRPTIGNVGQPQNTAGESEEAAGRCNEWVFLRIGYSKIAAGASISTANFTI